MVLPHANERFPRSLEKLLRWRISRGFSMPGPFFSGLCAMSCMSILRWYDWFMTVRCVSADARETRIRASRGSRCRQPPLHTQYDDSFLTCYRCAHSLATTPAARCKVGAGQDEKGKRAIYWNRETSAAPCAPAIEGPSAGGA